MKLNEIKVALSLLDITISEKDGEYRVNFRGGKEATAYYTNDLSDAFRTACVMKNQQLANAKVDAEAAADLEMSKKLQDELGHAAVEEYQRSVKAYRTARDLR